MPEKPPIINCHTHIFTGDYVPPYLAKTFVFWPLYYFLSLSCIVKGFRFWYKYPNTWQYKPWYKSILKRIYLIKMLGNRYWYNSLIGIVVGVLLGIQVIFILNEWISLIFGKKTVLWGSVQQSKEWVANHSLLYIPESFFGKLLILFLFFFLFKSGRKPVFFILKSIWTFLGRLPGPKSKDLAERYMLIGRFAFRHKQQTILSRLITQYPPGTGFVVLPMDMEYMKAGKLNPEFTYQSQMAELKSIKDNSSTKDLFFPFVFIDSRRIIDEGNKHFNYSVKDGQVVLEDCFIKTYIEGNKFSGFKIYPALGYYPFEEVLLPLWKYAADNELPIMTHCIRGTIFYRGSKKKEWDEHPVFEEMGFNKEYEPLKLNEIPNSEFINNFTHPLNYLCLLEETYLRKLVGGSKDSKIRELFGFSNMETELKHNLNHLKICFGHYGGDDEWNKFLELDRDNYSSQLIKNPTVGIKFLVDEEGGHRPGKIEQIWKYVDWYSIISSLMLQYSNVYSDLSYIIHSSSIQPLLKLTMLNTNLKEKVLFGTDFYVVRNHKSEKNIYSDILSHLAEEEFDLIARTNPRKFLNNKLHGSIKI
ncbi:amidohydrolase family protein [Cyclobacterium lianum]|nr:amidohydrolase family protein [Cyclobacterium lianum]